MTPVTVDLEDLKALVFATGVIKNIEAALLQAKADPFASPHLKSTHDRVAQAMRHAERSARSGETAVAWDAPLTEEEVVILARMTQKDFPLMYIAAGERRKYPIDDLASKGVLVIGQCLKGTLWAGESQPEFRIDPEWLALKITPRGQAKLDAYGAEEEAGGM